MLSPKIKKEFVAMSLFGPATESRKREVQPKVPFRKTQRLTLILYFLISTPIAYLFGRCRPTAVAGFVALIIVNTVKGMFWRRPRSHVGEEGNKPALAIPLRTNRNSSFSIKAVRRIVWVVASAAKLNPNFIFSPARHSMRCLCLNNTLTLIASTTLCLATCETAGFADRCVSTITDTVPMPSVASRLSCAIHDNESGKPTSIEFQRPMHGNCFGLVASTAFCSPSLEPVAGQDSLRAALATAKPKMPSLPLGCPQALAVNDRPPKEHLASQVLEFLRHRVGIHVSHYDGHVI